jgi:hypothetical protein
MSRCVSKNRRLLFGVVIAFLLGLPGCSGVRVSQDYSETADYSGIKTYAWQFDTQEKSGDLRLDNPLRDRRIRSAVDQVLSEKGYRRAGDAVPDVYIAYHEELYSRLERDTGGGGFVFGFGGFGHPGGLGFSAGNVVSDYDESLLVIDIIDAASGKLIWRGNGTRPFLQHADPQKLTRRIHETVQKILSQFPPRRD